MIVKLYQLLFLLHVLLVVYFAIRYREQGFIKNADAVIIILVLTYLFLIVFKPIDLVPDAPVYVKRFNYEFSIERMLQVRYLERNNLYDMSYMVSWTFWIGKHIGLDYYSFMFITILIQLIIEYYFLNKIIKDYLSVSLNKFMIVLLTMIFLGYAYQFIAFAASFAIVLGIPAVYLLFEKKYISAYILSLVSILFHSCGIANILVLLVLTFARKYKESFYLVIWGISSIGILLGISREITWITQIMIGLFSNILQGSFVFNQAFNADVRIFGIRTVIYIIEILLLILVNEEDKKYWEFMNIAILGLVFEAFFSNVPTAHRIYDIFVFYSLFPLLYFYEKCSSQIVQVKICQKCWAISVILLNFITRLNTLNII